MFILTSINRHADLASVFDTTDGTNEQISLQILALKVLRNELSVYGIHSICDAKDVEGHIDLPDYGVSVCPSEAFRAMDCFRDHNIS